MRSHMQFRALQREVPHSFIAMWGTVCFFEKRNFWKQLFLGKSCHTNKRMNISNLPLHHTVAFMGGLSRSWQLCRLLQAGQVFVQACAAIDQLSIYQSCAHQGRLNQQSNWSCSQFCIHTFHMGYGRTWCVFGCEGS